MCTPLVLPGRDDAGATSAADVLTRPDLGDAVDVVVGDHADHRVSAGDGVIGAEDDG